MSDLTILETIRWREGKVRILDQTRLPHEEVYRELATVQELVDAMRTLAVRGAPALGVAGAFGLALAARLSAAPGSERWLADMERAAQLLGDARPTAVNLKWALQRVLGHAHAQAEKGAGAEVLRRETLAEAERILQEDLVLSERMAEHGLQLIPQEGAVLTHCNTGGLATAGGGTALGVILESARRGHQIFVHVNETRPLLQGARLTAWELERAGIPYAIHCDSAAPWILKSRNVAVVLVGADRIACNGDTANKVGTLGLALAAREFKVPFYVVAPRTSFDLSLAEGGAIPIESRDSSEVLAWQTPPAVPPGALAFNPAFDVTPAALITGWVTDRGVEQPPFTA